MIIAAFILCTVAFIARMWGVFSAGGVVVLLAAGVALKLGILNDTRT